MNEEEIIKNVKEMIQWSDHNTYKMALQGLLDLYNKEKEKNKELETKFKIEFNKRREIEDLDLTTVYMNGFYDGEKKWKDKIKELLEDNK